MHVTGTEAVLSSGLPDIHDLPLAADVAIDVEEYARMERRIAQRDGATSTPVSAFNSSI
jgi:hypothetical protein